MSLYDQISNSLPTPNDTWTKTDILLYKVIVTLLASASSVQRTPSLNYYTNAGQVAAGAQSVSVENSGDVDGIWLGSVLRPGKVLSYSAKNNDTLLSFAYDASGTEFTITKIV